MILMFYLVAGARQNLRSIGVYGTASSTAQQFNGLTIKQTISQ